MLLNMISMLSESTLLLHKKQNVDLLLLLRRRNARIQKSSLVFITKLECLKVGKTPGDFKIIGVDLYQPALLTFKAKNHQFRIGEGSEVMSPDSSFLP